MVDVAIFVALAWERRAVTGGSSRLTADGPRGPWQGRLADEASFLIMQTGIGLARARAAAAAAPPARVFLSVGCAGALATWLRPGDVVVADGVAGLERRDRLAASAAPFRTWAAQQGLRTHVGGVVSSDSVLLTRAAKEAAGADGALVVEMESAAIAAEAAAREIPFVGLRVVLDVAGQTLPASLDVVDADTGELAGGRAVAALAVRPWLWPAALRLGAQTRRADRALRGLMAALLGEKGGLDALVGAPDTARAARA